MYGTFRVGVAWRDDLLGVGEIPWAGSRWCDLSFARKRGGNCRAGRMAKNDSRNGVDTYITGRRATELCRVSIVPVRSPPGNWQPLRLASANRRSYEGESRTTFLQVRIYVHIYIYTYIGLIDRLNIFICLVTVDSRITRVITRKVDN